MMFTLMIGIHLQALQQPFTITKVKTVHSSTTKVYSIMDVDVTIGKGNHSSTVGHDMVFELGSLAIGKVDQLVGLSKHPLNGKGRRPVY
jgi:hypothetical protein